MNILTNPILASWLSVYLDNFWTKDFATANAILITSLILALITFLHNLAQLQRQSKEALTPITLKAIDLYKEFWTSSEMAEARRLISNQTDYIETVEPVLKKRLEMSGCEVEENDYVVLEKIDRFYAIVLGLHRLRIAMARFKDKKEVIQLERTYGFWREILIRPDDDSEGPNRIVLRSYLERFWKSVTEGISDADRFGARQKATNKTLRPSGGTVVPDSQDSTSAG